MIVLEVTPSFRDLIAHASEDLIGHAAPGQTLLLHDWSTEMLQKQLTGHWVRFEGWLFYDTQHESEAENAAPGRANNWRATAWELHPVTRIEVIQ
jgi:hypothetical protein